MMQIIILNQQIILITINIHLLKCYCLKRILPTLTFFVEKKIIAVLCKLYGTRRHDAVSIYFLCLQTFFEIIGSARHFTIVLQRALEQLGPTREYDSLTFIVNIHRNHWVAVVVSMDNGELI